MENQTDLFARFDEAERSTRRLPDFDGETYERSRDYPRLSGQLAAVLSVMSDNNWRTLEAIAERVSLVTGRGVTTQSVSARLRDLRKVKFGGRTVERKSAGGGLFLYRLKRRCGDES